MTHYDYTNKSVLITGASKGVGQATARAFAKAGARVCIHYATDQEGAKTTLNSLEGAGHCILQADLREASAARRLVDSCLAKLGGLDILVNNAGQFKPHPVIGTNSEDWLATFQATINLNLTAVAVGSHAAANHWAATGKGGVIVNVGSRGAWRGEEGQVGYGASKAGLHALSRSLARELGAHRIRVHALAPGFIETAMARPHLQGAAGEAVRAQSPLNRVATVDEIARAILWLASPDAEWGTGGVMDFNGASYLH
ncbi:MAG: SDR family oxidoreductase [Bacteroidota bacterium]